jgi:hypothetical protein
VLVPVLLVLVLVLVLVTGRTIVQLTVPLCTGLILLVLVLVYP